MTDKTIEVGAGGHLKTLLTQKLRRLVIDSRSQFGGHLHLLGRRQAAQSRPDQSPDTSLDELRVESHREALRERLTNLLGSGLQVRIQVLEGEGVKRLAQAIAALGHQLG